MSFCQDSQRNVSNYGYSDPLGPTSMGPKGGPKFSPTGAPQMRSRIFDYLGSSMPGMNQAGADYASALKSAAGDPGWSQAGDLARKTMSGNYLNGGPNLDRALATNRAAAMSEAADATARIKSGYGKNGMQFSTAAEQADLGTRAAASARANQVNASTYLQNYLAERGNQNQAVGMLGQAKQGPLSYLSQVGGAYSSPLAQAGNLISGMSSGGQVYNTGSTGTSSPSLGSNIMNGFSGVVGSL